MVNKMNYRDPKHIVETDEVDESKLPKSAKKLATWIREKMYGVDVREAIARGIEKSSEISQNAADVANDTASRQDDVDQSQKDFEDRYNNQIAGNTDINEVIDARDDGKKTFTTLRERLNQTVSVNTGYFSNYEVANYFKPEIERVAAEIDKSKFNLLVNTDAHFSDNSGLGKGIIYTGAGKLSLTHFSNTTALSKDVDAVIAGGDQVEGNDLFPTSTAKDHSLIARKLMNNSLGADVFMILGNHDTDDQNLTASDTDPHLTNQKLDVVVRESQIKEAYQTKSLRFSETRDGDSLYFYKDYPDKKVRLIGINTSDIGELTTAEGYAKYSRLGTCVIGQRQMNWIANVALMTTPADYHVVMYGHIPLGPDRWSGTFQEKGYTNQKVNCDTLGYIIDAFKYGTSIHATNTTAADYPIDVTADFTQRGAGNFVAYFCGHVHHEEIRDFHSFKNVLLLNSLAWTGYNNVPGQTREFGSVNEDAQTVISIDTASRNVDLIGFGSATDRTLTY